MKGGNARIQSRQSATPPPGQFSEPRVTDLGASLQVTMRDLEKIQCIAPPYMFRVGGYLLQRPPCPGGARVHGRSHMHTQQCSLCEDARRETIPAVKRSKPMMNPIVVHVRIDTQRHEYVPIQQPGQASSSSASI